MSGGELRNGPLLQVKQLRKYYPFTKGVLFAKTLGQVKAVDDVSFGIDAGETLGLVGESGCGKTTTSKLILNLEEPSSGQVLLHGKPIHGLAGGALREYRARVQAVFQDPWSSLNPRMTIGRTIAESLIVTGWGKRADVGVIGALAADALQTAIVRAVEQAETWGPYPSARDNRRRQ